MRNPGDQEKVVPVASVPGFLVSSSNRPDFAVSLFRDFAFSNSRSGAPGGVRPACGQTCTVPGMERETRVVEVSEVSEAVARCLPGGVPLPEGSPGGVVSLPAARSYCRTLARSHYENLWSLPRCCPASCD